MRWHRRVAGVQHRKTARAIGRFHHAGLETGLTDAGGMLITRDAQNGDRRAEQIGICCAKVGGAVLDLGQHCLRDVEQVANGIAPFACVNIIEHRARRVCGIGGMHRATGQAPDQIGIDRAKQQFTGGGAGAGTLDIVEQPFQLGP